MKKILRTFAFAAVAAAAITACNKEIEIANPADEQEQVFTFAIGDNSGMTKSILGSDEIGRFVQFDSDDTGKDNGLGSIAPNAQGYSSITPADGSNPATFSIYTRGVALNDKITVWYPYRSKQTDATAVELVIPTEQNHKEGNAFDMKAMPMVTKQITVTQDLVDATSDNNTPIATINFANMGSLLNFKVFSTNSEYAGEQVMSITFTANANIGGTFKKNLATIDPDDETTMTIGSFTSGSASIVTKPYNDAASIGNSKATALDLYMVVAPGTYTGTVMVKTNEAEYTYTISSPKSFVRSGVKAFGLDLGNCSNRVAKQTIIPITVNKTINEILTEMGEASVDNGTVVNPLRVDNVVTLSTTGTGNNGKVYGNGTEWRLYQGGAGNAIVSVASGYELQSVKFVYTVSNSGTLEGASSESAVDVSGSSVSFDVINTGDATNGQVRLTAITVKYVSTGVSAKQDPTLSFNNPNTTVTVGSKVTNEATIDPNTLTVTYASSNTSVASVDASTGEVTGVAAGTATITASFAGNDDYNAATASYDITVNEALPGTPKTIEIPSDRTFIAGTDEQHLTYKVVTITQSKGTSSNFNTSYNTASTLRVYQNNTLRFESSYVITKIEFTVDGTYTGTVSPSVGSYSNNTWTGQSNDILFTNTGTQWRITSIKVTYLSDGNEPKVTPILSVADVSVAEGASKTLVVETTSDGAVSFVSGNTGVATVTSAGVVTGVSEGTATITVSVPETEEFEAASTTCTVTVTAAGLTEDHTATIKFGSADGSTAINATSVTGDDNQGNTWTITTIMKETSFTQQAGYSQIGASKKPATSITFTTTLANSATIKSFSAKFGGFSGTAGDVTLKVGDTIVGSGSLNETNDVTVSATNTTSVGTVLTVTVTNIQKGVKAYEINVTYNN